MEEDIQNYLPTVMFRGTPCQYNQNYITIIQLTSVITSQLYSIYS